MEFSRTLSVLAVCLFSSSTAAGQIKYAQLSYPAGDTGDKFGSALALLGDLALVGAPSSPWWTGDLMGFAVLCDSNTGENLEVITPSDRSINDGFGKSLGMSSEYIVVGANGAAYVFDTATRQELYKIDRSGAFGHGVAVFGSLAIVSDPFEDVGGVLHSGAAYLFDLSTGQQIKKLKEAVPQKWGEFGRCVAIHGGYAVVGTQGNYDSSNGTFCGKVYVYDMTTGLNLYVLTKQVPPGEIGNEFGMAVAVRGNRLLVGAPYEFVPFVGNVGAVYVYESQSGQELDRIASPTPGSGGFFGFDIALSDGRALIADPGHHKRRVHLFDVETRQELFRMDKTDMGSPGSYGFAFEVALNGNRALVSDPDWEAQAIGTAHALLFEPAVGTSYCTPAVVNSSGLPGRIATHGSEIVEDNVLLLSVDQLPPGQFGYFLTGPTQGFVANPGGSQGNLCLAGTIGRYVDDIFNSGPSGAHSLFLDLDQVPFPGGGHSIVAGETWNWTGWFRDNNPGSTSNFTDAVSVVFQ